MLTTCTQMTMLYKNAQRWEEEEGTPVPFPREALCPHDDNGLHYGVYTLQLEELWKISPSNLLRFGKGTVEVVLGMCTVLAESNTASPLSVHFRLLTPKENRDIGRISQLSCCYRFWLVDDTELLLQCGGSCSLSSKLCCCSCCSCISLVFASSSETARIIHSSLN